MEASYVRPPVVLIVEDEPLILRLAADLISEAGYANVSAKNADEAIAILEQRDDIRVVFTDVNMPGSMDGLKLARAVRGRWPPVKIVITSAFSYAFMSKLPKDIPFVAKPYDFNRLSQALHGVGL